jgi:4-alpha-glucanotransferase
MNRFFSGRHAGLLVPLFSMPSTRSWGIGEIPDIEAMAAWLETAGLDMIQLLPVNEMAEGENSPYSAMSAMAIDPIFISVGAVPEFQALGGEAAAPPAFRDALSSVRSARSVQYKLVRQLKRETLRASFDRFHDAEWSANTARADAFRSYAAGERWWLDDYALFRALHAKHDARAWWEWDEPLRRRLPAALEAARRELAREILFYEYLQWIADAQWRTVRASLGAIGLFGDFPFMVSSDSADVWARQREFRLDASVGVPPDAFSETGQDWGLPAYRWSVMRRSDFEWLRHRARRSAALFAGYRIDHLVGFYRTYVKPHDGSKPSFTPAREADQVRLGEQLMQLFSGAGPRIIAEDLGTVPDFVRASLARLGVPGYKVLRWEREWHVEAQPFRDPSSYPAASVATSGTHDTEPMAIWWESAGEEERRQVLALPRLAGLGADPSSPDYTPAIRDALLRTLFSSGADFLILPIEDVFGWRARINVPGTVTDENWTYRLPWPSDALVNQPDAVERAQALRRWSAETGRTEVMAPV